MGASDILWMIAPLLVVVGAINWGIVGFSSAFMDQTINLVQIVSMDSEMLENGVYIVVGIAGLISIPWIIPE